MKVIFLSYLCCFIVRATSKELYTQFVGIAISELLKEFFFQNSPKIDVISFGDFQENNKIFDFLLKREVSGIVYKVVTVELSSSSHFVLNSSSVLIFDAIKTFENVHKKILWQENPEFFHIVYCPHTAASDFSFIKDGFLIDHVDFITNVNKKSIELSTTFMFTALKCRSIRFETINIFNTSQLKWNETKEKNFYSKKYSNMHECNLTAEKSFRGIDALNKIPFFIVGTFAEKSNAKLQIFLKGEVAETTNLLFLPAAWNEKNASQLISYPYYFDNNVWFIPPGEPYTSLEKMMMPFQQTLWVVTMLTLLVLITISAVIVIFSSKLRILFFDTDDPVFGLVSTFLAGYQNQLPSRDIARFSLTMFIIWSLIIRTCYQSELFKYLQKDARKPEVKSIVEMIERNFTFYANEITGRIIIGIAKENNLKL